jgi:hypothetical protein
MILDAWARYARRLDPWVCYGSKDCFYTRRLDVMRGRASAYEQIVPSPMRAQYGLTIDGRRSQHTLAATGPRLFLVAEFDFVAVNKQRKPTIWADLITRCKAAGRTIPDLNAALCAHLRGRGPFWLTAYSGGKSLQSWFPCRGTDEAALLGWFRDEALTIGACPSTWTRFQFVRMPDGERDDGRRQSIEYYNPDILSLCTEKGSAVFSSRSPDPGEIAWSTKKRRRALYKAPWRALRSSSGALCAVVDFGSRVADSSLAGCMPLRQGLASYLLDGRNVPCASLVLLLGSRSPNFR